jgi:hypothetical protein
MNFPSRERKRDRLAKEKAIHSIGLSRKSLSGGTRVRMKPADPISQTGLPYSMTSFKKVKLSMRKKIKAKLFQKENIKYFIFCSI